MSDNRSFELLRQLSKPSTRGESDHGMNHTHCQIRVSHYSGRGYYCSVQNVMVTNHAGGMVSTEFMPDTSGKNNICALVAPRFSAKALATIKARFVSGDSLDVICDSWNEDGMTPTVMALVKSLFVGLK